MAVYALDLRGRGKSDGERFYVETFDDYVSDVSHCDDSAGSRDKTLKFYDGDFHDLLNERGTVEVMGAIIEWIAARVAVGQGEHN